MSARRRILNSQNPTQLKKDALALLESELAALSPDEQHKLHLKMGMERELSCVPHEDEPPLEKQLDALSSFASKGLESEHGDVFERVYRDVSSPFILEVTTKPLSPAHAVQGIEAMTRSMIHAGDSRHFDVFSASAPASKEMMSRFPNSVGEEIVPSGNGKGHVLVGQGAHANISLWAGDTNLFYQSPYDPISRFIKPSLGSTMVSEALDMLPGLILPSRKKNYDDIAAGSQCAIYNFECGYEEKGTGAALNWISCDDNGVSESPKRTRIEFRQGTSDADPLDLALAAAIPITRTFLKYVRTGEDGKAVLSPSGDFEYQGLVMHSPQQIKGYMPRSFKEAAEMFNPADGQNPNFVFLDELAERRVHRLEKELAKNPQDKALAESARDARKLLNIGTKIHHSICQEYGLESSMPLKAAQLAV